jgi:excisionase family DNA binding protein
MNKPILSIKEAAEILGVSDETLRNYERDGKLSPTYTDGGHRRYKRIDIEKFAGIYIEPITQVGTNRVAIYCRVSSHEQKQKGDLERQIGRMTQEALKRGYKIVSVFDEVGSGMNDSRKKLHKLFELVETNQIDIVLVEHKDRLSRFCFNYLVSYFKSYSVKIELVEEILGKGYETELVEDILSLMASFSAKIYGKRSSQNRRKVEKVEVKNV